MQIQRKIPVAIERYLLDLAIAALFVILYAPLLIHWIDGWLRKSISLDHEYFSHGLIGFPFAAYIVWTQRRQWQTLPNQSSLIGVGLLLAAAIGYLSPLPDLVNLSLPLGLAGLCFWLKGWAGFRLQSFPLLLVLLATPTSGPYLIAPFAVPLQRFIAGVAGFILTQLHINVRVEEVSLYVGDRIVEVAPHCAGLKMLFTTLYVSLMLLYWRDDLGIRNRVLAFIPCALITSVAANILRNTLLTFFHGTGREPLFAWLHEGWGGDLYSACMLGLLIPLLIGIERLVPEPVPPSASESSSTCP